MLRGVAGPSSDGDGKKIVALADLNVFRVGFGERTDIHQLVRVFQTFDVEASNTVSKTVPLINLAYMVRCSLVTHLVSARTGLERATMELATTGVELELNPSLFSSYKLLELELQISLEKAKLAAARARFLYNELKTGVNEKEAKSPPLTRSSLAEPENKAKPRARRMSLTTSMQSILRLGAPAAASPDRPSSPSPSSSHKRSTSAEPKVEKKRERRKRTFFFLKKKFYRKSLLHLGRRSCRSLGARSA